MLICVRAKPDVYMLNSKLDLLQKNVQYSLSVVLRCQGLHAVDCQQFNILTSNFWFQIFEPRVNNNHGLKAWFDQMYHIFAATLNFCVVIRAIRFIPTTWKPNQPTMHIPGPSPQHFNFYMMIILLILILKSFKLQTTVQYVEIFNKPYIFYYHIQLIAAKSLPKLSTKVTFHF